MSVSAFSQFLERTLSHLARQPTEIYDTATAKTSVLWRENASVETAGRLAAVLTAELSSNDQKVHDNMVD